MKNQKSNNQYAKTSGQKVSDSNPFGICNPLYLKGVDYFRNHQQFKSFFQKWTQSKATKPKEFVSASGLRESSAAFFLSALYAELKEARASGKAVAPIRLVVVCPDHERARSLYSTLASFFPSKGKSPLRFLSSAAPLPYRFTPVSNEYIAECVKLAFLIQQIDPSSSTYKSNDLTIANEQRVNDNGESDIAIDNDGESFFSNSEIYILSLHQLYLPMTSPKLLFETWENHPKDQSIENDAILWQEETYSSGRNIDLKEKGNLRKVARFEKSWQGEVQNK